MASSVDIYGGGGNEKLSPNASADHDYNGDPASSSFFSSDTKKNGDLRAMLEGNKDGLKLEAMKRLIGMIARGNDAADLFPFVVKNVVCKNLEVKKLVYVYLVRYAEEQQDLALLSISTFQKALKDPNQLIRASALRVLSSIRVSMIVPIMMLSIREAMMDMSPYVRKTAALAIPKLYSLDPHQKEELVTIIQKLLGDRTTLVIGSAIMAFEEVCPEKLDLLHKHYRKLCQVLVDVDEWGQVIIIQTLTRYARTQFVNPNIRQPAEGEEKPPGVDSAVDKKNEPKKSDDEKSDADSEDEPAFFSLNYIDRHLELDHRMLLRNCRPLLQSRNSAVVMAVIQLYFYVAPEEELVLVTKPLIRMLRSHPEIQSVVLANIKTLSASRTGRKLFEPHLRCFFVRATDPTSIKLIKLRIITNLASKMTISLILREFQIFCLASLMQNYIASCDAALVAHTIQAIGYCASTINEVSDLCLNGLVNLLSNHDENVVAESIVVIRKLLQMKPEEHKDVIRHMAKLYDRINIPSARASILWLIGEYCEFIPKIAPDVLRKAAQTFVKEDVMVKQQVVNLAVKLYLTNPQQTSLLMQYVITLARYDQNYDLRDRVRLIRALVMPSKQRPNNEADATSAAAVAGGAGDAGSSAVDDNNNMLTTDEAGIVNNGSSASLAAIAGVTSSPAMTNGISAAAVFSPYVKRIFLTSKPAPWVEKRFRDAAFDDFRLGTLSHCMHSRAPGYEELPDFPLVAPDSSVRHVEMPPSSASNISTSRGGSSSMQSGRSGAAAQKAAGVAAKKSSDDEEQNFWTESDEDDDDEEEEDEAGKEKKKAGDADETTESDEDDDDEEEEEDSGEESDDEEEEEDEEGEEDDADEDDEESGSGSGGSVTGDELTEPAKPISDRNKIRHQNRHGPPSLAHQQAMADAAAQDIAEKMRPRTSSLSLKNVAGSLQAESDSSGDEASAELDDEQTAAATRSISTPDAPDSDFGAHRKAIVTAATTAAADTSSTSDETAVGQSSSSNVKQQKSEEGQQHSTSLKEKEGEQFATSDIPNIAIDP